MNIKLWFWAFFLRFRKSCRSMHVCIHKKIPWNKKCCFSDRRTYSHKYFQHSSRCKSNCELVKKKHINLICNLITYILIMLLVLLSSISLFAVAFVDSLPQLGRYFVTQCHLVSIVCYPCRHINSKKYIHLYVFVCDMLCICTWIWVLVDFHCRFK